MKGHNLKEALHFSKVYYLLICLLLFVLILFAIFPENSFIYCRVESVLFTSKSDQRFRSIPLTIKGSYAESKIPGLWDRLCVSIESDSVSLWKEENEIPFAEEIQYTALEDMYTADDSDIVYENRFGDFFVIGISNPEILKQLEMDSPLLIVTAESFSQAKKLLDSCFSEKGFNTSQLENWLYKYGFADLL